MNRRSVLATGVVGLVGSTGCVRPADESTSDATVERTPPRDGGRWRMADHDPAASGHAPGVTPSRPGDPAWTTTLPPKELLWGAAVDGERVYYGATDHAPTPSESRIVARSVTDDTVAWSRSVPYTGVSTPALGVGPGGRQALFLASGQDHSNTGPGHGVVWALDPTTGEQWWEWAVDADLGGLVAADGTLLTATTALDHVAVWALNATDGTERWTVPLDRWLRATPTVHDVTVYVGSANERLRALSLADGTVEWQIETTGYSRPVIDRHRSRLYLGQLNGVRAFDLDGGGEAWFHRTTGPFVAERDRLGVTDEPVVTPEAVIVRTSDTSDFAVGDPGQCHGLDPATGERVWSLPAGRPASSLVGAGGRVLLRRDLAAGSGTPVRDDPSTNELIAVTADGTVRWSRPGVWHPVAVGADRLVAYRGALERFSGKVTVGCFSVG
ncbi:MAG: PQQ-binding-like beta-propeller repeat protein [Halobaculum sp.]